MIEDTTAIWIEILIMKRNGTLKNKIVKMQKKKVKTIHYNFEELQNQV